MLHSRRELLTSAAALGGVVVFGAAGRTARAQAPAGGSSRPGVDLAGMDTAVAPGDDFFAYANGSWLKTAQIPPDRSSWGVGAELIELTNRRTADLIKETAAGDAPHGSDARKIADTYAAFMDEAGIEALGLKPLAPKLARIAAISSKRELAGALGADLRAEVDILNATNLDTDQLFGLWVAQDLDDPSRYVPFLLQGGLGLPDREYYRDASARMQTIRDAYKAHIAKVLALAGAAEPAAQAQATAIFDLEHSIAEVHASRADSEDVQKGDNHWKRADFDTRAPGLDWSAYFAAAGLGAQADFVVWQPGAVIGIAALMASAPLETWRAWLRFHTLDHAAPVLPKAFVDENFAFYGHTLSGTPVLRERWKRAVAAVNDALGEAVGKIYAARYFPPEAKAQVRAMADNLLVAFGRRIDGLTWMAPATKVEAKAKLKALKIGVGYPDKWRDYSSLEIRPGDALGNLQRAERFEYRRNLAKLGAPVDRGEWVMTPQTVNAVNLPAMNALNFPAAILQPPYFDPAAPSANNYGGIGATIGHEISHSFDDQGALFDASGRLRNWWTAEDFAHFRASGAALAKQYDGYRPFPDLAVNGTQCLSENIADVAGLAVCHDAWRASLGGRPAPVVGGFTGEQQYFIAFAQSWRSKAREAALRRQILTDGHAPAEYRGDTVRNLDAWYEAFSPNPGQHLYLAPADRVRIWG